MDNSWFLVLKKQVDTQLNERYKTFFQHLCFGGFGYDPDQGGYLWSMRDDTFTCNVRFYNNFFKIQRGKAIAV